MYSRWVETYGSNRVLISESPSEAGGFKEIIFIVRGESAYKNLKFEAGVHRVQRISVTQSQGRIHTSTVTVAVLPEAEEPMSKSARKTSEWTSSGPAGTAANQLIPPTPPCASPTCPQV